MESQEFEPWVQNSGFTTSIIMGNFSIYQKLQTRLQISNPKMHRSFQITVDHDFQLSMAALQTISAFDGLKQ
jgi:hypothetical protein